MIQFVIVCILSLRSMLEFVFGVRIWVLSLRSVLEFVFGVGVYVLRLRYVNPLLEQITNLKSNFKKNYKS